MAIIEVEHLTKEYRLGQLESLRTTAVNQLRRLTGKPLEQRSLFKALDDVSFQIDEGEVVGIIGHNGAGKSTLLKMLAGITTPTSGRLHVKGRISPLIEVGAGFVPELTGRENVYLNGSILGLSRKDIDKKFDAIVDFAEMEQFIDTPVKRYSSGMKVKLAFAVATSIDSELLIVDEVLAVGDLAFQQKCIERIETLIKREGRTVLIVGHNIRQLERISSRMMLMDKGHLSADGLPKDICAIFYRESQERTFLRHRKEASGIVPQQDCGIIQVTKLEILNDLEELTDSVAMHDPVTIRVTLFCKKAMPRTEIVFGLKTPDFVHILSVSNLMRGEPCTLLEGWSQLTCRISEIPLRPFSYSVRLSFIDQYRHTLWYAEDICSLMITAGSYDVTRIPVLGLVDVASEWTYPSRSVGPAGATQSLGGA